MLLLLLICMLLMIWVVELCAGCSSSISFYCLSARWLRHYFVLLQHWVETWLFPTHLEPLQFSRSLHWVVSLWQKVSSININTWQKNCCISIILNKPKLILLHFIANETDDIKNWWIWGYWISPLMYGQNALMVNEFLSNSWHNVISWTCNIRICILWSTEVRF